MKKIFIAASLAICAFASFANATTRIQVADEGEIVLSKDGDRATILNKVGPSYGFHYVYGAKENGCTVSIFEGITDASDLLTITLCERDKPMVKLGRYIGETKVGQWLVDASRYVTIDDK